MTKIASLLGVLAVLTFAAPVRAEGPVPAPVVSDCSGPLCLQLDQNWSLHLNVSVAAFAYNVTQKQLMGQVTFTGLYVLDYKKLVGLGLGASIQTNDRPGASMVGMLASPSIPLTNLSRGRIGLLGGYQWAGVVHDWMIAFAPTIEF